MDAIRDFFPDGGLLIALFMLFALLLSAVAWVELARRWRRGEEILPLRFRDPRVRVPRFALVLALAWMGLHLIPGSAVLTTDQALQAARESLISKPLILCIFLGALIAFQRTPWDLVKLGFRCDHIAGQIGMGAVGALLSLAPVFLVMLLSSPLHSEVTQHPYLRALEEYGMRLEILPIIVGAVVLAPLLEELLFRVILQSWLVEFAPAWLAIGISSLIFAAVHGFPNALGILPLAVILGTLYHRQRSYLSIVVLHALFNACNLLGSLARILLPD